MPSTPDRSPSALSSPSGRSLFSRLASPFGSKPRHIADFYIETEDPHKQHSPGDTVKGHVRLRVSKATRLTHLVVCLHGFVQVYRNPGSPDSVYRANKEYLGTGTNRGKKSGEYFGNGFASLFEDELTLCGDGKLADGTYQFNFELEFPDRDLPSSIDFERGTITYMITATLTRPTAISPTIYCDRKVYFVERIDISPLYPPKPRTITLAPVSRRSRAKHQARKLVDPSDKRSRKTDSAEQGSDTPRQSEASSALSSHADTSNPDSPDPSEMSFESILSSRRESRADSQSRVSPSASEEDKMNGSKTSLTNKTITATIESQAGGCLRGDNIPVKVVINHTKPVKSVYGVIVTLFRQARVDMHPSIPLGPTEKGKGDKYEDYYPKSVTGLGGLSLTGAGSSHIFRKDLSQVILPLYINPQTLTQEINAKVRVPDEAFPTISTVPGAMISFKYYVEVILDIQGRLANQDRILGNLSGIAGLPGHTIDMESSDMERSAFTPFGSTVLDTAPIRRDKSVVTSTFEVIIGTRDSERRKGKRKLMDAIVEPDQQPQPEQQQSPQHNEAVPETDWYDQNAYYDYSWYDQQYWDWYYRYHTNHGQQDPGARDRSYVQPPPPPVPLPQILDESQMTEKERMHQAEQRLLPSHPPGMENGNGAAEAGPTAPYVPGESDVPESAPTYQVATSSSSTMPGASTLIYDRPRQMSVVPEYEPPDPGYSTATLAAGDDKQELQRQQLQNLASGPPTDHKNDAGPSAPEEVEATAPSLTEAGPPFTNDTHDSHVDAEASMDLPVYER